MKFLLKNNIKFEIILSLLLMAIISVSLFSYSNLSESFNSNNLIALRPFDTIWIYLYWINFIVYQYKFGGMLINILFYTFLSFFPIFGLIYLRQKKWHIALHIFLLMLIIAHLIVFNQLYFTLKAIASV
ncbi:hypothetical protein KKA33_01900 [Patescibacteria group bacterium]|nr:hypothetical protein [Patescibacteria group bacterium]